MADQFLLNQIEGFSHEIFNIKTDLFVFLFSGICLAGCGAHYSVKGQVIDAKSKLPVEGAAVGIEWTHYKIGPPGLPTPKDYLGTTQTVTDDQGFFEIPQHTGFGRYYTMGICKKDYICWVCNEIFNPDGATYEEMYQNRVRPLLREGMIFELQPIEGPIPLDKYADFTSKIGEQIRGPGPFYDAIKHEQERARKMKRKTRNSEERRN